MIERREHLQRVIRLLRDWPVVALLGARQVGKTTLAAQVARRFGGPVQRFDLEDPRHLARLSDPMLALADRRGLVVLDEIQRLPSLLPVLRVLADRRPRRARFLVLGSASPEMIRHTSETLAGRIAHYQLDGFNLQEVGIANHRKLWLRGGFPRSYLARSHAQSLQWREQFIRTFLERDIPQLGVRISPVTLRRFWTMVAHYHGQRWNSSELARSFGVADTTVRGYLDLLSAAFVVRLLLPWHANVAKRQVRAPKIYLADSGLLHALLGLRTETDLLSHPKLGASWEGFVISQIVSRLNASWDQCYFWATHAGAELDLLVARGRRRWGFEVKRTSAPRVTPSMRHALRDLKLQRLVVVHAGPDSFDLAAKIRAVAIQDLLRELPGW